MARGFDLARRVLPALLPLSMCGCPNQELAALIPCTVSTVSLDASQSGTDKVDLLFVIDNSGSMSEEQQKLNAQLRRLVEVLTSGDFDGMPNSNGETDFQPVSSLRLGVISTDLGSNGATGLPSCGNRSYAPTEQDTGRTGADSVDRPFGDDAQLLSSTAVAAAGVSIQVSSEPVVAIAPRPECAGMNVPRFLEFPSGGSAAEIAAQFSCIAQLGVNGCGVEQQLESMWKALAPSTDRSFSRATGGQGAPTGLNKDFVRPDAILAVVIVTDEEDCSNPDASVPVLYSLADQNALNVLCGRNPNALHNAQRYIAGLKSLKSDAFQDRVIFAGIVGVPLAVNTQGATFDQILARADMQFAEEPEASGSARLRPRPVCVASGGAGNAAPARRIVEVARGFGENGVITSICEDNYTAALNAVISKIAGKLSGQCLPRSQQRNAAGLVDCRVVEIKGAGNDSPCDASRGRIRQLDSRRVNDTLRTVCEVAQLPVLERREPPGVGWYYDDFSEEVKACKTDKQRIAFAAASPLEEGASARFECFRAVTEPSATNPRGVEAINTPCADDGSSGLHGNEKCAALSEPGTALICVNGSCQVSCTSDAHCPAGRVCTGTGGMPGFCENPTCPMEIAD
jgi:hypothetical protein